MTWSTETGAGHAKAILWSLVLVVIIYVGVKVIPILVAEYQFKDGIQEIARQASVTHQSTDQIRQQVLKEAEKDDFPIQPADVKVETPGKTVHIVADVSVTVDLGVYQWVLNLQPEASNDSLL